MRRFDDNDAPRKKIIIRKISGWTGDVVLTESAGSTKIKVFTAATGDTEIAFDGEHNKFANSSLPKDLFVQGDAASGAMRDVELKVEPEGVPQGADTVKFTVLWVTVTTKHLDTDTVPDDNAARDAFYNLGVPPSYNLGYRLIATDGSQTPEIAGNSRGSEFIGTVELEPSNFVPGQFSTDPHVLHMDRELVSGNLWWGVNGNENQIPDTPGSDTSNTDYWDDDPQSGESGGKIYDLDGPAITGLVLNPGNLIFRKRTNFRAWAVYDVTRCSAKKEWYTRQSYKRTGPFDGGTASGGTANTLIDATDGKDWNENEWAPGVIGISAGTGAGQIRRITGNTATTITTATNWSTQPDNTSQYQIIDTSTWVKWNDVDNDNKNDDGTTNTSWNLQ